MKKLILLFLCLLILLTGCIPSRKSAENTANFYYCKDSDAFSVGEAFIQPEERAITEAQKDLSKLLRVYFAGPEEAGYRSPLPDHLAVISCEIADDTVFITLSDQISRLTGSRLTVACACISLTVLDYTNAESVVIRAQNSLLDGSETVEMSREQLAIFDPDSQK